MATDQPPELNETPSGRRAEHLGSSALTVRVRCACGRKQDVDRRGWQASGVAICASCGSGILYRSLQLIDHTEARRMLTVPSPTDEELTALYRMEQLLRDFISHHDEQPRWLWAPATTRMADSLRPLFELIDEERAGRPSPLQAEPVAHQDAVPDEEDVDAEDEGGAGDQR